MQFDKAEGLDCPHTCGNVALVIGEASVYLKNLSSPFTLLFTGIYEDKKYSNTYEVLVTRKQCSYTRH